MSAKAVVENHLKTGGEHIEDKNKLTVSNQVSTACFDTFQEMKIRKKHRYIIFKLGEEEIEIETVGDRDQTYQDFKAILPFTECRYGIFDHEFTTADGRPTSKLWFVSWFPENSTTQHKMAYTSAKSKFRESIPGVFDVQVSNGGELDISLGFKKVGDDEESDGEIF